MIVPSDKMAIPAVRYETLLRKSNQDDLLKNWGLTLTLYLDDFMAHLQEHTDYMNFSEAAMLLQNSTTFYCKRVDVVHKIIQELVTEVSNIRISGQNEELKKNAQSAKRKKATKSLEMDDLQVLDFVSSEQSIDVPVEKLVFRGVPRQIVLCSAMKALRKGGTSVTIYQSTGNILGCKEEFRIFGKTYSDGTVNEDFNHDNEKVINQVEECEDDVEFDDLRDDSFHMDIDMTPEAVLPEAHQELSTQVPEMTVHPVSPSLPITAKEYAAAPKPRRKKNFDWEPVPCDFKIFIKPFKAISRIAIPKNLESEEMVDEPENQSRSRKRKRRKNGEAEKAVDTIKLTWIDIAIKGGSFEATSRRIQLEIDKRKEILKSQAKGIQTDVFQEPDDAMGAMDDHDPHDFEDLVDDNEAAICTAPLTQIDEIISEEGPNLYVDEALKAIEKFKENRRENASRATEVAKRVAAWHESIMPVLEAAESRSKFDVHEYGSRILTLFPDDDLDTFRPFRDVVVEQPKNEICRYFLSTLMLANTYNLEIRKGEPGPLVKDCVELRLITKVRHHEEMDEALRVASEDCGS